MFFEAEERPWTHHLKKPMGGLFAVSLGLLVCLADVKLPAETNSRASASRSIVSMRNSAAFYDHVGEISGEADIDDLSEAVFIPVREPAANPYDLLIHEAAGRHDVDSDLIRAIIMVESQFNPSAKSKRGAKGLMQVMPRDGIAATFQCINGPCFASRPTIEELKDPVFNVEYGVRMLAGLINRHGNTRDALKAYGPGDVGYWYADKVLGIYSAILSEEN